MFQISTKNCIDDFDCVCLNMSRLPKYDRQRSLVASVRVTRGPVAQACKCSTQVVRGRLEFTGIIVHVCYEVGIYIPFCRRVSPLSWMTGTSARHPLQSLHLVLKALLDQLHEAIPTTKCKHYIPAVRKLLFVSPD